MNVPRATLTTYENKIHNLQIFTLLNSSPDCFQRDQELACFNASTTDTFWNKGCTPVEEVCAHFNFTRVGERDDSGRLTCFNGTQDVDLNNVSDPILSVILYNQCFVDG